MVIDGAEREEVVDLTGVPAEITGGGTRLEIDLVHGAAAWRTISTTQLSQL